MSEWLHGLVQQIIVLAGAHPSLVGLVVFIFSCSEGIAIIGAALPGETILFGVAAIAGAAGADPWVMVLWATLGAATGDGISFWMGRTYGASIISWRGLRSNPDILKKGEKFIQKHGAKSVAIARFLPVIRSIVPVAAGIFKMDAKYFYIANITSAFAWALVHIFPAVALGIAYKTLGEVSGRIAVIALFILVAAVFLFWLVRLLILWVMPHLAKLYALTIKTLSERSDRVSIVLSRNLDWERRGFVGFALWGLVLVAGVAGSMGVLEDLIRGDPLVRADVAINHLVQGLRTEPVDEFMILVTSMGDSLPLIAVSVVLIGVLLFQRAWRPALAAIGVIATASAVVPLIKLILHKPRPIQIYSGAEAYSFPSGHTTMTAVVFGIFAVLVSRGFAAGGKIAVFSLFALWVGLVGASRIYLSAHWPSDVMGGMLFGLVLTAVFALLINQVMVRKYSRSLLAAFALAAFVIVGGYHASASFEKNLAQYAPRTTVHEITVADWLDNKWQLLPANRIDLGGEREESLLIQWAGNKEFISSILEKDGWYKAKDFTWLDGLKILALKTRIGDIAPLPILHNGSIPVLTFIRSPEVVDNSSNERFVLRFWRSDYVIENERGKEPMFLGSVTREVFETPISWIAVMREKNVLENVASNLAAVLGKNQSHELKRTSRAGLFLIWPKS